MLLACLAPHPASAQGPKQIVYAALYDENNIAIVDPVAGKLLQRIQVGRNPDGVLLNADHSKVYVANTGEFTVSIVSVAEARVTQVLRLPVNRRNIYAGAMARTPDGRQIFVAERAEGNEELRVYVIDTERELIVGQFEAGRSISSLAVSSDGARLFVVNKGIGVGVFNTADYTNAGSVQLIADAAADVYAVACSPVAPKGAISYGARNRVQLFSTSTLATETVLDMPKYKTGIQTVLAYSNDGAYLTIVNHKRDLKEVDGINVVNVAKSEIIKIFNAGVVDLGMYLADDNKIFYTAAQDLLKWYNMPTLEHIKSISLRTPIRGIAVVTK